MRKTPQNSPSILVLGSRGFIGSVIFRALEKRYGTKVRGLTSGKLDLTKARSSSQLARVSTKNTVLVVVCGIRAERDKTLNAFEKNVAMMVHTAQALEKQKIAQCIYISTVSVYGSGKKPSKITEKTPLAVDSLYALAKYAGEKLLETACTQNNVPLVILRLPRVYGFGDIHAQYGPAAFVNDIAQHGKMTLYGDGSELREFLYVEDIGKIIELVIENKTNGIVNVVSGTSHSFIEAAEIFLRTLKKPFAIEHLERTGAVFDEVYDNTLFRALFPDFSFTTFKEGIRKTYEEVSSESK